MQIIGYFSERVIETLGLDIAEGTPIYIGKRNEEHIEARHPYEYDVFCPRIKEIISDPDYVGINKKNGSIDYVKVFVISGDYVQVSVRVSSGGFFIVRTLFALSSYRAERFIQQGTLKKI